MGNREDPLLLKFRSLEFVNEQLGGEVRRMIASGKHPDLAAELLKVVESGRNLAALARDVLGDEGTRH